MPIIPDNFKQIVPSIEGWVEHLSTDPLAMALQNMWVSGGRVRLVVDFYTP